MVLIPSYNTGPLVMRTVAQARHRHSPVWVIVDGSTDGTAEALASMAASDPGLLVIAMPRNSGKGAALLEGLRRAAAAGFTHALTFDADGQHPPDRIPAFRDMSARHPGCMILGVPVFAADAPRLRVGGRRVSNWWARLETGGDGIGDSLFGMRVYPIAPLLRIMDRTRWMRRFDFEPEAAVRLCWAGVAPINLDTPVRYLIRAEGGVSHFHYVRDNALLTLMHIRLMLTALVLHLPTLLRLRSKPPRMPEAAAQAAGPPP